MGWGEGLGIFLNMGNDDNCFFVTQKQTKKNTDIRRLHFSTSLCSFFVGIPSSGWLSGPNNVYFTLNPFPVNQDRAVLRPQGLAHLPFSAAYGFDTLSLAHRLDSLVRIDFKTGS